MRTDLLQICLLIIPIIIGGISHMIIVKRNWLARLKIPLNESLFGCNKTWRGLIVVPIITGCAALLLWPVNLLYPELKLLPDSVGQLWLIGACGGSGYMLFELPNSWIKRRLNIPPGATPQKYRNLFILCDQIDSAIGVVIAYLLYPGITLYSAIIVFIPALLLALAIKQLLYLINLKRPLY